ncbi:MAG: rhamnogalacturonan lyase [Treponemataceae bacterium]|nr:rhamnogalacturonan lyase [Treponemataceae bacterium]
MEDLFNLKVSKTTKTTIEFEWNKIEGAEEYSLNWKDRKRDSMESKVLTGIKKCTAVLNKAPIIPYYVQICAHSGPNSEVIAKSPLIKTPVTEKQNPQLENLDRGLIAVKTSEGVFLSWRLFKNEVTGATKTSLKSGAFGVFKNGSLLATVQDSTNFLDKAGTQNDVYQVELLGDYDSIPLKPDEKASKETSVWKSGTNYIDIPLNKLADGITPAGEKYTYSANDISIGDVNGDGELEFIVKWDPSNSHDVSIKGYTGNCYIDCYTLSGTILWRIDMGCNIRSGAHYTQFMVYDFDGDGKAEISMKTAPGTKITRFNEDGSIKDEKFITLPERDVKKGISHEDNYVSSAEDFRNHLTEVFMNWHNHPEVVAGHWPSTLEDCFGIEKQYNYPLSSKDAEKLVDYFIKDFAPSRSPKNQLDKFEGFIYEGPEYMTMFAGDGSELETIDFPFPREDDGLLWGDYAMRRIEPCNRVDRFLSGVAFLDGERPYLIVCRGYYTRTCIAAYDFFDHCFNQVWKIDSGHVPMTNPFNDGPHGAQGTDPVYGIIAGQGNHSLSTADVDGDGFQEIIYGGCCIDHDGSVLYSSFDKLPDGTVAKLGHGDAMHVANINPDLPGYEIFNVFEGAKYAPYGFALRDAETGKVYFGEYAETDLGRCMIGDIVPGERGLQVWVKDVYNVAGKKLDVPHLSTNMSIRWAADLTTQLTDSEDYLNGEHTGVINDNTHGTMLTPENTLTNNGTKGNPCLVADIFGDFREEIVLRTKDSSALRIYTNTEITKHKLFTLLHDVQYRTGIAWQNNCYNQPCYTSFYYASDMDFREVLPGLFE